MTSVRRASAIALALLAGCTAPDQASTPERVLVTSGFTDQLFVLDASDGAVIDSVSLDRRPGERDEPHGVAVSADGRHAYVTLAHGEPSLWKFETDGMRLVGRLTLETNGASRVRLSPDGLTAAIPDYWLSGGGEPSRVAFVRTEDLHVLATPIICPAPHDAAYSPGGARIAVACPLTDEVVLLNALDFGVVDRIPLRETTAGERASRPLNVAWLGEDRLAVALHDGGGSYEVNLVDRSAAVLMPGGGPAQVALSPDGHFLVTANRRAGTVSLRGPEGGVRSVDLGPNPHGVAFGRGSDVVFVTTEGDPTTPGGVAAIETDTGAIRWSRAVGSYTLGIAVIPGG